MSSSPERTDKHPIVTRHFESSRHQRSTSYPLPSSMRCPSFVELQSKSQRHGMLVFLLVPR